MSFPEEKLEEVRTIFSNFLKERNQRHTPERFLVLEEVYAAGEHLDADELYLRLKRKGTRISRATVYNTLELLLECDISYAVLCLNKKTKYEPASFYRQNNHLIYLEYNVSIELCDPRM